eukprot:184814-Alexandrium_andersonii.AAC.1
MCIRDSRRPTHRPAWPARQAGPPPCRKSFENNRRFKTQAPTAQGQPPSPMAARASLPLAVRNNWAG